MSGRKRFWMTGALVALIPAAALAWWLGSPLFINRTVNEELPVVVSAVTPAQMAHAEGEGAMGAMADTEGEMAAMAEGEAQMAAMSKTDDEEVNEAMTAAGAVKTGAFRDGDSRHRGSGRATIYRLEDGSHVLRLEDFRVTNGPDLRVLLSSHPDPENPHDVKDQGYLELGKLKGNRGNQNYEIPADLDIDGQRSVVIYCKPFSVVFSVASFS